MFKVYVLRSPSNRKLFIISTESNLVLFAAERLSGVCLGCSKEQSELCGIVIPELLQEMQAEVEKITIGFSRERETKYKLRNGGRVILYEGHGSVVALADEKGAKAVASELRSKGYQVEEKLDVVLTPEWVYENFKEKVEKAVERSASLFEDSEDFF